MTGLVLAGVAGHGAVAQQPCYFAWKDPVSGIFSDVGKWDPGPPPPAGRAECQGTAPRLGDLVSFRQGTYLVAVDGVRNSLVAEFGVSGPPPFDPHDVSFEVMNAWTIGQLFTSGTMTVGGEGRLGVGEYFMGHQAQFVLDGGKADFSRVIPGNSPPPASAPQFLVVGERAVLTTSGPFSSFGVEVDGGSWNHTAAPGPGSFAPTRAVLKNGAFFTAVAIDFPAGADLLAAESGSRYVIGRLNGGTVHLTGGSRMDNTVVSNVRSSGSQPSEVHGPGSVWSISGALTLKEAFHTVRVAGGGHLLCATALIDDLGSTLQVRDADSRVSAETLEFGIAQRGSLSVQNGGRVDSRAVFLGGQTSGVGEATVTGAGSALVLSAGMLVGDAGQGRVSLGPGGTILLDAPSALGIGFAPSGQGTMTVAGANAFLDARQSEVAVGKAGTGELRMDEGGAGVVRDLVIGEANGAAGTVGVTQVVGRRTTLQVLDRVTVGSKGHGVLTVSGPAVAVPDDRARLSARSLSAGGSAEQNLMRVLGAGARLEIAEDMRIGDGGNGSLNMTTGATAVCRRLLVGLDPELSTGTVAGNVQTTSPNTVLAVSERLAVGAEERGALFVRDGSRVDLASAPAAVFEAGTTRNGFGLIAVTGANALISAPSSALVLGGEGSGLLHVSYGGRVVSRSGRLAVGDFSQGSATVGNPNHDTLATASWQIAERLDVGEAGFGVLYLLDGGRVEAGSASVGRLADSQGNVLAVGQASLVLTGGLSLGEGARARACSLGVVEGAMVTVGGTMLDCAVGAESEAYLSIALPGSTLSAPAATTRVGVEGWARCDVFEGGQWTTGPATLGVGSASVGSVYVGPDSHWRVNGPLTVGAAGEAFLVVDAGGRVTTNEAVTIGGRGRVSGTGTLTTTALANNGTLEAGSSPGALAIAGDFSQAASGKLEMEIGGLSPGLQHDTLTVTGTASLGGRLSVRFINGFAPSAGQTFRLIEASGPLNGNFATVTVAGVGPGFQYEIRRTPDARGLELAALSTATAASTEASPSIHIEKLGLHVVVSWSAPTSGFVLQGSPDLKGPWSNLTTARRFLVTTTSDAEFFRVARP